MCRRILHLKQHVFKKLQTAVSGFPLGTCVCVEVTESETTDEPCFQAFKCIKVQIHGPVARAASR